MMPRRAAQATSSRTPENAQTASHLDSFLVRAAAARVAILCAFHTVVFAACYAFAYLLRFEFAVPAEFNETFKWSLPVVLGVQLLIGIAFGFYRGWWRYVGMADVVRLVFGLSAALALLLSLWYVGGRFGIAPRFLKSPPRVLLTHSPLSFPSLSPIPLPLP